MVKYSLFKRIRVYDPKFCGAFIIYNSFQKIIFFLDPNPKRPQKTLWTLPTHQYPQKILPISICFWKMLRLSNPDMKHQKNHHCQLTFSAD